MAATRTAGRLAAFVFEGGGAVAPLGQALTTLRDALTLDLLGRLREADLGGPVVLATDRPALAEAAAAAGFAVEQTPSADRFHYGETLRHLVRRWAGPPCTAVLCAGGAAAPLATAAQWQAELAPLLRPDPAPLVLANNPQSPDVVAFAPPHAVFGIGPVPHDNALAWALREAGLTRELLPPAPAFTFDIDTPVDAVVLQTIANAGLVRLGPHTQRALAALVTAPEVAPAAAAAQRLLSVLQQPMAEIGLVGRVGTPAIDHANKLLPVRLRVFSEERGMKGLGREERGEVRSLLGALLDDVGPERFWAHLTGICDACLLDVRVLLGHWQLRLPDEERFALDLLVPPQRGDDRLRAFIHAARQRLRDGYPLLLGGHSLVSGGLQWLAEAAAAGKAGFASETACGVKR